MLAQGAMLLTLLLCLPQVDTISQAVVTASRLVVKEQRVVEEIIKKSPFTTVSDVVRTFTGIQVKDFGGIGGLKTVNVRSLGASHTTVLYNGVRIQNAQNGQVDFSKISLNEVSELSFSTQPGGILKTSTELHSSASVNITNSRGGSEEQSVCTVGVGSFNSQWVSAKLSRKATEDVRIRTGIDFTHSEGRYPFTYHTAQYDTTVFRNNGDIISFAGFLQFDVSDYLSGTFRCFQSDRGLPNPVVRRVSDQYKSNDRQLDADVVGSLNFHKSFGKVALLSNLSYSYNYLNYKVVSPERVVQELDNNYKQQDVYFNTSVSYKPCNWCQLGGAVDASFNDLHSNVMAYSYASRWSVLSSIVALFSYNSLQANLILNYSRIIDNSTVKFNLSKVLPKIIVGYNSENVSVRALYSSTMRVPTFNDLYYTVMGVQRLQPEFVSQFSCGGDVRFANFTVSLDYFHTLFKDKIVAIPIQSMFRWSMINYGIAIGNGAEVSVKYQNKIKDWFIFAQGNYTLDITRDCTDVNSTTYQNQIAYTPAHSGSVSTIIQYKTWSVSQVTHLVGSRYREASGLPEDLLPFWTTTDFSLSKEFQYRTLKWSVSGVLNNIFNDYHEVITGYPMPGFNAQFKITVKF